MKKECFKEDFPVMERRPAVILEALAKMKTTKTGVVFQGRKRYAEAEEEE